MQHGVLAFITHQVRTIRQYLVAVWRSRLRPDFGFGVRRDETDEFAVGDVRVSGMVKDHSLRVAGNTRHFDGFYLALFGKLPSEEIQKEDEQRKEHGHDLQ
jgi:hypothetical protein